MEAIGDSILVDASYQKKDDELDQNSVEFERNLDDFKKTLEDEESRLKNLEEKRLKLQQEIEEMYREINEEKKDYRKSIDGIIEEREKYSRSIIDSCKSPTDLTPIASSLSLFNNPTNFDINIDQDIEKIRCELMESYISTKEDYLSTIKEHFQQKKKKLEDDSF
jgi:DNA repair exonuclease SbcCD ATPase subunit